RSREASVLEERARLARELHDAVSQRLFSIRAHARAAEMLVGKDPALVSAELAAIADIGAQAHAELRAVIDGLAPPELDGLAESLRRYAQLAARAYGVEVLVTAPDLPELEPRVQAAAFRVGQEALNNALRHAAATKISVRLTRTSRRVVLEVSDDGTGFDQALAAAGASGGLGLASMRERAAAVGGTLRITSEPGVGTKVKLAVPA
ncbi:MAG TPA: sensor histidine kinase, partial [Trebonia sp.]|nr:sensor histidine kinase [Trebonia sp.]